MQEAQLLDKLRKFQKRKFNDSVYRLTKENQSPIQATGGGRWATKTIKVLYTSLEREGAIAEFCYHRFQRVHFSKPGDLPPLKPSRLHVLAVAIDTVIRLDMHDIEHFGFDPERYKAIDIQYHEECCQMLGQAVVKLGVGGLLAPSARWDCDNLMLFPENGGVNVVLDPNPKWLDWPTFGSDLCPQKPAPSTATIH